MTKAFVTYAVVLATICLAGCKTDLSGNRTHMQKIVIGKSVDGRPIHCDIYDKGKASAPTVLILASIHGNEHVGTPLVQRLGDHLREQSDSLANCRVMIVPEVNPDGAFHQQRHNTHGIDLNRNFPARNWNQQLDHGAKPLSEPESRALHALIKKYKPTRIISLHQPLTCMDYDGPAEAQVLAEAMSGRCDLPVKKLGGLDGSLGSYAGETLHIPIVTVEFDRELSTASSDELWKRYGPMLLTAINYAPAH